MADGQKLPNPITCWSGNGLYMRIHAGGGWGGAEELDGLEVLAPMVPRCGNLAFRVGPINRGLGLVPAGDEMLSK